MYILRAGVGVLLKDTAPSENEKTVRQKLISRLVMQDTLDFLDEKDEEEFKPKRGGIGGKIVALLLGFILGFLSAFGGLIGGGYYLVAVMTIKQGFGFAASFGADIDYSDYISEAYADKTVLALSQDLIAFAGNIQNKNFQDLNDISPAVETYLDQYVIQTIKDQLDIAVLLRTPDDNFDSDGNIVDGNGIVLDTDRVVRRFILSDDTVIYTDANGKILGSNEPLPEDATPYFADGESTVVGFMDVPFEYVVDFLLDCVRPVSFAKLCSSQLLGQFVNAENGEQIVDKICHVLAYDENGDEFLKIGDVINGVKSGDILSVFSNIPADYLIHTLNLLQDYSAILDEAFYGRQDIDYSVSPTGEIVYLPKNYVLTESGDFLSFDGFSYKKNEDVFENETLGEKIVVSSSPSYDYLVLNGDGELVFSLKQRELSETVYDVYDADDNVLQNSRILLGDFLSMFSEEMQSTVDPIGQISLNTIFGLLGLGEDSDGPLAMLSGLKDKRICELMNGSLMDLFNDMQIATLFGSDGYDPDSGDMFQEIIYKKTADGEYVSRTLGELADGSFMDSLELAKLLGISATDKSDKMYSLAFDKDGKARTLSDLTDEEKRTAMINDFELASLMGKTYEESDSLMRAVLFKDDDQGNKVSRTVKDLTESDLASSLYLKDVLGVSPLNDGDDMLMVSLAYGTKDKHYKIENNEIVWLTNPATGELYSARTLNDIKDASTLIDDIALDAVLNLPSPSATSDNVLRTLVFGHEGVEYDIVDEKTVWRTNPETGELYAPRTVNDLKGGEAIANNVYLTDIFGADADADPLLNAVSYQNGKPTTIKQLSNGDIMWSIPLKSVVPPQDAITEYIVYGKKGVRYEKVGEDYVMKKRQIAVVGSKAYDEKGKELGGSVSGGIYTDAKGVQHEIKEETGLTVDVNGTPVALHYVFQDGDYELYAPNTIQDLKDGLASSITEDMTIGDLMPTANENTILKHLCNSTISSLPDDFNTLSVQQVFEDKVYKMNATSEYFIDKDGNRLYPGTGENEGKFYTSDTTQNNSTLSSRVLTGTWKYLLTDTDGSEKEAKLTELTSLTANMATNIQKASLRDLNEDGIITFGDSSFLDKEIKYDLSVTISAITTTLYSFEEKGKQKYKFENGTEKEYIGDLSITELMDYMQTILTVLN